MQPAGRGRPSWRRSPVSILIRPSGRMQRAEGGQHSAAPVGVSILIRPSGRMQLPPGSGLTCPNCGFQSSSGQKDGCNPWRTGLQGQFCTVSILIRPEGRMQPMHRLHHGGHLVLVSILIRPEGWMQLAPGVPATAAGVNPHPSSFNPHPARRPDATTAPAPQGPPPGQVSILIRPEGRMQHAVQALAETEVAWFQSSSGQKPDATFPAETATRDVDEFQSSSGQKAGCNLPTCCMSGRCRCFNPHPARRPDATS